MSQYFVYLEATDLKGSQIGGIRKGMNTTNCMNNCANDPACSYIVTNNNNCYFMKNGGGDHKTHGVAGWQTYLFAPRMTSPANPKYVAIPNTSLEQNGRNIVIKNTINASNETELLATCDATNNCSSAINDNGKGFINNTARADDQNGNGAPSNFHPDVFEKGGTTTYLNAKEVMAPYCKERWASDPQCQTATACSTLGPNGNCDDYYKAYCGLGDNIFSQALCQNFAPSKPEVVGDLKMAWCRQGNNFLDDKCLNFCNSKTDRETSPTGFKGQCDSLYTSQCSKTENMGKEICSCVKPFKNHDTPEELGTRDLVLASGGTPDAKCYFPQCQSLGYKTALSGTADCNACIMSQTLAIQGADRSQINNATQSCNVKISNTVGGTQSPTSTGTDGPPPASGGDGLTDDGSKPDTPEPTGTPTPTPLVGGLTQQQWLYAGLGVLIALIILALLMK